MKITPKQFSELVYKVFSSRTEYTQGNPKKWHPEDLSVLYSTVAEDVGLTLTFAEELELLDNQNTKKEDKFHEE